MMYDRQAGHDMNYDHDVNEDDRARRHSSRVASGASPRLWILIVSGALLIVIVGGAIATLLMSNTNKTVASGSASSGNDRSTLEKLVGIWELVNSDEMGELDPVNPDRDKDCKMTVEFTKDGKFIVKPIDLDGIQGPVNTTLAEGTYVLDGERFTTTQLDENNKVRTDVQIIKTLTETELVIVDEKGKTDVFRRAVTFTEPGKAVTEAEKKEFLKILADLPAKGEFFTDEAVKKALPYTRVLLALTEKDLEKQELYPFLALSSGLMQHREAREYGLAHFAQIGHPIIKLSWAIALFDKKADSPEIRDFLCKALDSKDDSKTLSLMLGPGYEDFKDRVQLADEAGKQIKIELAKQHKLDGLPPFRDGFDYKDDQIAFLPGPTIVAVRPLKQAGELYKYRVADHETTRLVVPQPKEFKPRTDLNERYFSDPHVMASSQGDVLCRWTMEGNGDHGFGLLKRGSDSFQVRHVKKYLDRSFAVADADGNWYLIADGPRFKVYQVDKELNFTELGQFNGKGFHSFGGIADARFISKGMLHLFWGDVLPEGNHLRMRCVDFDVQERKWLHGREIFRVDKFVSSSTKPMVVQLNDNSLHYFWRVDEGEPHREATGLYYQAEADGKTIKISTSYGGCRALAIGDRIVVCYTLDESPLKVFFRVIRNGVLGPVTEVTAAKDPKYCSESAYMVLYSDNDRIWFMNTHERDVLFELKMIEEKKK